MKFYFAGSEVKSWRDLLASQNVTNVALSFVGLQRRIKGTHKWEISSNYAKYQNVFLDSGAFTINKNAENYPNVQDISHSYIEFVSRNIDSVAMVSEFDAQSLGYTYIEAMREDFYNQFVPPEKFMPVWHESYGMEELEKLASRYRIVGIVAEDIQSGSLTPKLNSLVNQYGVRLHGAAVTGREIMKQIKWDSVASTSWLSPSHFGDTIIWTGRELKRVPRAYKEKARNQYKNIMIDNGFDYDKILADDSTEVLKLSIWSWGKYMEDLEKHRVTTSPWNEKATSEEIATGVVDTLPSNMRNELLPVVRETVAFEAALHNESYTLRTPEQQKVLHSALIDLQAQRVVVAKKLEDAEGGFPDINLSAEIDRLNRLIKTHSELERTTFSVKVEANTSDANAAGFFSGMFGQDAGEKLTAVQLKEKEDSLNIIDADVVSDSADE